VSFCQTATSQMGVGQAAMGGKWLSLLGRSRQASNVPRSCSIPKPRLPAENIFLASFEAAAGSLGIEPAAMRVRSDAEIETAVANLSGEQAGSVDNNKPPRIFGRPKSKWLGPVKGPRSAVDADASESQHRKRPVPALPLPAPPLPVRPQPELQVRLRPVH
jgi:hypothetical protein